MEPTSLGGLEIRTIIECVELAGTAAENFPDASDEALEPLLRWLAPAAYDLKERQLIMPVHSYVVRSRHHTILIDTCIGNHKRQLNWPAWHMQSEFRLLDSLIEAGVHPDEVDYVFCTHMHVDHVGWNTRLENGRWVPSFANARYIFARRELEFSEMLVRREQDMTYEDSVLPIVQAGQAVIVEDDFALDDEIWLEPTPGHTPGHVAVRMHSRGRKGVVSGDLIHSPIQLAYPDWSPFYDEDPELARHTRRHFLEAQCDRDILVMTMHFPAPSMGHIVAGSTAFAMKYHACDLVHGV